MQELQKQVRSLAASGGIACQGHGSVAEIGAVSRVQQPSSSLPAETEVLIVVLTPYWYGVETEDGHRGWIHHSQLESLP